MAHDLTHVVQQDTAVEPFLHSQKDMRKGVQKGAGLQGVRFINFLNLGVGLTHQQLGPIEGLTYIMNAVELQFEVPKRCTSNTVTLSRSSG